MSLSETQQIYEILTQIDAILKGINLATEKMEQKAPSVKEQTANFRQLERLALRYLVLAKQLGLPEDVNNAITKISQLVISIRMMQTALQSMTMGPYGAILGVATFALSYLNLTSMVEGY